MNAFEARQQSIDPQYERISEAIKFAIQKKRSNLMAHATIFPEVAERLASEGFDVIINTSLPGYQISWENATIPGIKGTITEVTDNPFKELSDLLDKIFSENYDSTDIQDSSNTSEKSNNLL